MQTYHDRPFRTVREQVPGALRNRVNHILELHADGGAQLATNGLAQFAIVAQEHAEDDAISCRILGKGGTVKLIQSGAIAFGARLCQDPAAPGRVRAIPAGAGVYRSLGIKLTAGNGAAGDVIEVNDIIETVTVT